jgi:hypothetical protein
MECLHAEVGCHQQQQQHGVEAALWAVSLSNQLRQWMQCLHAQVPASSSSSSSSTVLKQHHGQ